jgi:hypothetical protein
VANEEVLAKAEQLYELLRSRSQEGEADAVYRTLRRELMEMVGREALPDFVRNSRSLDDYLLSINVATEGQGIVAVRLALKDAFEPLFARLEGGGQPPAHPNAAVANIDVFISHSSDDQKLAAAIVDLFVFAMHLPAESIRCTSVEGSGLAGGDRFDERLRKEIAGARVFVALITPALLRSHYSLFELGARWGGGGSWKPVIARGIEPERVPAPLSQLHVLDLRRRADAEQFLDEVATTLERTVAKKAAYTRHMEEMIAAATEVPPGYGRTGLSSKERLILRALFDEPEGRKLQRYRNDHDYAPKLIKDDGSGNLRLTKEGSAMMREYLLSVIESA